MAAAPPGSLAAALGHASALLDTDPARAEGDARAILERAPGDPRARLILASALRRQGDAQGARALLEPLAADYPGAALTRYELGLSLGGLGDADAAIAALRHAVSLQRDLPEAWLALGDQLFRQGDVSGAEAAYAEHLRASVRDPALRPAAEALFDGAPDVAERLLRARLIVHPGDAAALQMLGEALSRQGRLAEAGDALARSLELEPGRDGARFSLSDVLFRQQRAAEAIVHLEALLAEDPGEPAYRNLLAACLGLVGDYGRALEIYERLLEEFPKQPKIWLNYGHALRTLRRREDAIAAYNRCIALAPGLGDAYWSLANLKTAPITAEVEAAMGAQLLRPDLTDDDRLHMHYALGKALEDRAAHAGAFEHYAKGAALRRRQLRYDAGATTALMQRSKSLFTPAFFAEPSGGGSPSDEPIFIVGLPRSGSTLIEQILASHPLVEGTMELPDIALLAAGVVPPGGAYPEAVAKLSGADRGRLGEAYLERTRIHRKQGRRFFIDKMPNNFHHLGLIRLILPRARIIDARRHPLGSCFSAFKQQFAYGHAFSYDLGDLGRYYRDYVELMSHYDAALPGWTQRVIYEDLVADLEGEVRRLLAYCGLPFDAACLRFYESDRPVRTVSSEQVRRPIFREGVDQWRAYEPWLGELKQALGPALENWRGAPQAARPSDGAS
ncbi:MAG TPA: sulfotransferase [Phenylobacterium sp.]|nr:sulfotransferase [Phenylobacterium sp.]